MQALTLLGIPKNSKPTWSPNFLFPEIPKNAKINYSKLICIVGNCCEVRQTPQMV